MDSPSVFLICVNRLVCEAVNVLLSREGIKLLGMETDPQTALAQVRALRPDIVVVEGVGKRPAGLLQGWGAEPPLADGNGANVEAGVMSALAQLAYERANLRIIQLSLPDEELRIFHQEQRRFLNTYDLVAAIRSAIQVGTP